MNQWQWYLDGLSTVLQVLSDIFSVGYNFLIPSKVLRFSAISHRSFCHSLPLIIRKICHFSHTNQLKRCGLSSCSSVMRWNNPIFKNTFNRKYNFVNRFSIKACNNKCRRKTGRTETFFGCQNGAFVCDQSHYHFEVDALYLASGLVLHKHTTSYTDACFTPCLHAGKHCMLASNTTILLLQTVSPK